MDKQYGQLIEPSPQVFHFGAPGWYVLAGLLLIVLVVLGWFLLWSYRRRRYRRQALKAIELIEARPGSLRVYGINMLLKLVATARYGRRETADLRGKEWIDFLNRSRGAALFDQSDVELLEDIYGGDDSVGFGFSAKAREWIRKHKRIDHAC